MLQNGHVENLKKVRINDGYCSCCNELLCVDSLKPDDINEFITKMEQTFELKKFKNWIDKNNDYQVILDGANIGYFKQRPDLGGNISFSQIDMVYEHFAKIGKSVLIFLHKKHSKNLEENKIIYNKWKKTNSIYFTPFSSNDDTYWLYYYLRSKMKQKNTLLITNDNLNDHIFKYLDREKLEKI